MRTSIIVIFFLTVFASTTAAQNPAKICQQYANDAVRYQQHNQRSGCGLRGPQWNDNFRYHYNWCVQGNNWRSVADWTAWRHKLISDCQRAKAPKKVVPLAITPMKVVPLAKTPKAPRNVRLKPINHLEKDLSTRLNHGMTAIRNKTYKSKTTFHKIKTVPLTGVLLASPSLGGKQRAQFDKTYKISPYHGQARPQKAAPPAQDKVGSIHPPQRAGGSPAVIC